MKLNEAGKRNNFAEAKNSRSLSNCKKEMYEDIAIQAENSRISRMILRKVVQA